MPLVRPATFSPVNQADTFEIQRQKINALAVDVDAGLIDGLQYPYIYSIELVGSTANTVILNTGTYGIVAFSQYQIGSRIESAQTNTTGWTKFLLLYDVAQDRYKTSIQVDGGTIYPTGSYGIPTQSLSLYDDARGGSALLAFKIGSAITVKFAISPTGSGGIPNLVTHTYALANRNTGTFGFNTTSEVTGGYSLSRNQFSGADNNAMTPAMLINAVRGAKGQNAISFIGRQALTYDGVYTHNQNLNNYTLPFSEDRFAFSSVTIS